MSVVSVVSFLSFEYFFFSFLTFFLLPFLDLAVDVSTTWISVEVSREEYPLGESGKVIIGEVVLEELFLLLPVLTEPIRPSAA